MSDIGRNDACPCGSGLKYKRCCLGLMEAQAGMGSAGGQGLYSGQGLFSDPDLLDAFGLGTQSSAPRRSASKPPIGGTECFRHSTKKVDSLPLLAPGLAHSVAFGNRVDGRRLYQNGLVKDLSRQALRYEAWITDQGREYRGCLVFELTEDGMARVEPQCTCSSSQRYSFCSHLYAMMLHSDAETLGSRLGQEVNPHSIDEVLWERLKCADMHRPPRSVKGEKLDARAAMVAREVDRMEVEWRKSRNLGYGVYGETRQAVDAEFDFGREVDDYADDIDDIDFFDVSDGLEAEAPGLQGETYRSLTPEERLRNFECHSRPRVSIDPKRGLRLCYLIEAHDDQIFLAITRQIRKKTGQWGAQAALKNADLRSYCLNDPDRSILTSLQGSTRGRNVQTHRRSYCQGGLNGDLWAFDPEDDFELEASLAARLLPLMIQTGCCFLFGTFRIDHKRLPPPLVMDEGDPLRFVIVSEEKEGRARLVGELRRGEETVSAGWKWLEKGDREAGPRLAEKKPSSKKGPLSQLLQKGGGKESEAGFASVQMRTDADAAVPVLLGRGHVVLGTTCYALEPTEDFMLTRSLLVRGPLDLPDKGREDYLRRFVQLPGARHLQEGPLVVKSSEPMRPRLTLEDPTNATGKYLEASIEFDYGEGNLERRELARSHFWHKGRLHRRDFDAEARYIAELDEQGILVLAPSYWQKDNPQPDAKVPQAELEEKVLALIDRGWDVWAADLPLRRTASPSLRVVSGRDWFEVEGGIDFDDYHVPLPELLKLRGKKKRRRLIRLGDGSYAIQVSEWLDRWLELMGLGEIQDGALRLRSSQAWLLDAMLEEHKGSIQTDETFAKAREALSRYVRVEARPAPKGFGTELRHYQQEGLGWMLFLHDLGLAGCLADDMGLGKTVQVLALLEHLRQEREKESGDTRGKPGIVVAPRSLLDNWEREAARFCPKLKTLIWYGPGRFKQFKESYEAGFADVDLVLITYGTLRRDIGKFREIGFGYAILDEAQAIKNSSSQASKAARLLVADHRLALTGTPIENHLGEIWSLFDFLNPGMMGRSTTFKAICSASASGGAGGMARLTEEIRKALGPFLLRRTKEEVLPDLPSKTEQVLHIELPKQQRKMYDELRRFYQKSLLEGPDGDGDLDSILSGKRMHILEALLRLRQAACHPGLVAAEHAESVSGKFESLLAMLDELLSQGHKALVFSQFTGLLKLLKPHLDQRGVAYEYLDGQTMDRQQRVDRFQSDDSCSLFLISIKAGGVGLNLTAADYVFILDPWWNPAVESQAVDRAHRIGQTKKVLAYRLIARDTVEEHVAALQDEKRELVDAVMAGSGGGLRGLSVEDIRRLLH